MPEVVVDIAGRSYRLGCGEGEEAHLAGLAAVLDTEAQQLQRQFGQVSEGRLMLMTALLIADRLSEAQGRLRRSEERLSEAQSQAQRRTQPEDLFATERDERLVQRLTLLAEQIESVSGGRGGPSDD